MIFALVDSDHKFDPPADYSELFFPLMYHTVSRTELAVVEGPVLAIPASDAFSTARSTP